MSDLRRMVGCLGLLVTTCDVTRYEAYRPKSQNRQPPSRSNMALVPYECDEPDADVAELCLACIRRGVPPLTISSVVLSNIAINLVPVTSDMEKPPSRYDLENNRALLLEFLRTFPRKVPNLTDIRDGYLVVT